MKRLKEAKHLLNECIKLGTQIDYLKVNEERILTSNGQSFLSLQAQQRRSHFAKHFLSTYPSAPQLIFALQARPKGEIDLPDVRRSKQANYFSGITHRLGINAGIVSFYIVRNILEQLGLVNWFPFRIEERPYWRIYLTSIVSETQSDEDITSFTYLNKTFFVKMESIDDNNFSEILWKKYMETTNYVPLRPVFYSNLRTKVCYELKISDFEFDKSIKGIMNLKDTSLRVVWSSGTLPYDRDSANLLKNLPPKSEEGQYFIYLKIDKRS
jgi:hypothetical protein